MQRVGACRGDVALTCNAEGNDFDLLQCPLGCDPAGGGCRLCEPSQTACTNGTLATCDDSGAVVDSQACPLGCVEDEPRYRDIDPSEHASWLNMVEIAIGVMVSQCLDRRIPDKATLVEERRQVGTASQPRARPPRPPAAPRRSREPVRSSVKRS